MRQDLNLYATNLTKAKEQAFGTLCNLAGNTENQARIAAAGGIERVISAMAAHPQVSRKFGNEQ